MLTVPQRTGGFFEPAPIPDHVAKVWAWPFKPRPTLDRLTRVAMRGNAVAYALLAFGVWVHSWWSEHDPAVMNRLVLGDYALDHWTRRPDPLPILTLTIDEAADLDGDEAADRLARGMARLVSYSRIG